MSPFASLRTRRSADGLPPPTSDDELLAWSGELVAPGAPPRRPRLEPLRAARGTARAAARRIRLVPVEPPPPPSAAPALRRTLRLRRPPAPRRALRFRRSG